MILDWLAAIPAILVAIVVVFVPGLVSLAAAGMRGLALVAFAPVMSTAVVSLAAVALSLIGIDWSVLSVIVVVVLVAALAWAVGRVLPLRTRERAPTASGRWMLPAALVVGALIGAWRIAAYIADPTAISQTNDAVFHLNALQFIRETGSASALDLNAFIGASGFYPAAWHGLASMVVLLGGASIPVAANALTIVIAALVWPIGLAWFARATTGSNAIASFTAVLSGALQTFPMLLFQWGVLYPNALSVALLPAALAVVLSLPSWSERRYPGRSTLQGVLFGAIALCALGFAQPASVIVFGLIGMIWFSWWVFARTSIAVLARIGLAVAGWVLVAGVWTFFSGSTGGSHWAPFRDKSVVLFDVAFNGHLTIPYAWVISALMIVGLVVAVLRGSLRWTVVAWAAISALYVLAATIGIPFVRDGILGAWYADPYRMAALVPVMVIPLAAIGFDAIVRLITRLLPAERRTRSETAMRIVGMTVISAFMVVLALVRPVAMPDIAANRFEPQPRYEESDVSYLSIDERELLESLVDVVGDDAGVIANPSTGASFAYLFGGVDVFPRTWAPPATAQWQTLAFGLRDAASDPAVCEALETYGAPEYVLDFGIGEQYAGRYEMPGMTDFDGQPGFEPVGEVGDASLWRITACSH